MHVKRDMENYPLVANGFELYTGEDDSDFEDDEEWHEGIHDDDPDWVNRGPLSDHEIDVLGSDIFNFVTHIDQDHQRRIASHIESLIFSIRAAMPTYYGDRESIIAGNQQTLMDWLHDLSELRDMLVQEEN